MFNIGRLSGDDANCTEITIADNKLSGSIRDTSTRPDDKNFGGDQSQVYGGRFTGQGGDTSIGKYTASRYAKVAIVQQVTGAGAPQSWMVLDNVDNASDVRLNNGQLDCRQAANVISAEYEFSLFF